MNLDDVKEVIAKTNWTYHNRNESLKMGPYLQAMFTSELSEAVQVLDVDFSNSGGTYAAPTTQGAGYTFCGYDIDIIASAIPNFPELKARSPSSLACHK